MAGKNRAHSPLSCLCVCLLLSSSARQAMSMDLDDDEDDFTVFAVDVFSPEPARRLYDRSLDVLGSNSSRSNSSGRRSLDVLGSNSSRSNSSGSAFCRLLDLQVLDLSNNQLTGELPDCWWQMEALQFMDLSNNSFSGEIPAGPPSHKCSLQSLHLAGNRFTGAFPSIVGSCSELVTLDIANNRFVGDIPHQIWGGVSSLKILSLRSNNFTGVIPSEISQLSQLQLLDLSNNSFTGLIPREFGNLTSMKNPKVVSSSTSLGGSNYLDRIDIIWKGKDVIFQKTLELVTGMDLSSNLLSQCIPENLTNLEGLRFLNLSSNHLSCSIPERIGSFKYLEALDLSLNELSGAIPVSLSDLTSLSRLNLSNNRLSGKIPTGNQLQTLNDASSYENNPELCGSPLNISCTNDLVVLDKRNGGECQDQWLYYCVIAGIVFGFWLWFGMLFSVAKWRFTVFLFIDRIQYKIMEKVQEPIDRFVLKENSDQFLWKETSDPFL